jgi:hypothetical protein
MGQGFILCAAKKAVQLAWMHLPEACAAQGMCGDCADKKDLAAGL